MSRITAIAAVILPLLIPSLAQASCASGTVSYYTFENTSADICGTYDLTNNGSVPYGTSSPTPYQGSYDAGQGGFSATSFFSAPSGFLTAMSSLSGFAMEGSVYINGLPASQGYWVSFGTAANATSQALGVTSAGAIKFIYNETAYTTANGVAATGAWYYWAINYDGTNYDIYWNLTGSATTQVIQQAGSGTVTLIRAYVGRLTETTSGFEYPINAEVDAIRFSSVSRGSSFPTTDPSSPKSWGFYEFP